MILTHNLFASTLLLVAQAHSPSPKKCYSFDFASAMRIRNFSTIFSSSHSKTLIPINSSSKYLYQFSRFNTKSTSNSENSSISSTGSSLICSTTSQSVSDPSKTINSIEKSQCKTGNFDLFKLNAASNQVYDIVDIIRRNGDDLESKLDSLNVAWSNDAFVAQIFRVLNNQKVSASRFFNWIRNRSLKFPCNSDIYSLLIDNFGRLDYYDGMLHVLTDFRQNGIGLNYNAFGFLSIILSNEASIKIEVKRVVELLNKVGGSCRISGIIALIQMLCFRGSFGMAKFVIEITEKRTSFYNVIVREKCRINDFEGARDTLNEMRKVGCYPDVGIYNYLLSSMCKNDKFDEAYKMFDEMLKGECPPDSLTYEVIIYHLCGMSKIDVALSFLEMMVSRGVEPRLSTHAAFVKSYFNSQRYEDAYQYAADSSSKHAMARNANYSLLASLHEKRGNLVVAQNILSELIDAGLRPNFPVYMRVLKKLQLQGKEDLASNLRDKFSNVSFQCHNNIG